VHGLCRLWSVRRAHAEKAATFEYALWLPLCDIQSATALAFHQSVASWECYFIDPALKASRRTHPGWDSLIGLVPSGALRQFTGFGI
jgi:hypothetical protein